eukprot:m.97001 g.97001  ORF g.97001 m.97001 type:complete len:311 (-) comp15208_c3_seq1:31-963(-)
MAKTNNQTKQKTRQTQHTCTTNVTRLTALGLRVNLLYTKTSALALDSETRRPRVNTFWIINWWRLRSSCSCLRCLCANASSETSSSGPAALLVFGGFRFGMVTGCSKRRKPGQTIFLVVGGVCTTRCRGMGNSMMKSSDTLLVLVSVRRRDLEATGVCVGAAAGAVVSDGDDRCGFGLLCLVALVGTTVTVAQARSLDGTATAPEPRLGLRLGSATATALALSCSCCCFFWTLMETSGCSPSRTRRPCHLTWAIKERRVANPLEQPTVGHLHVFVPAGSARGMAGWAGTPSSTMSALDSWHCCCCCFCGC